jgi:predicted aspartyl protease
MKYLLPLLFVFITPPLFAQNKNIFLFADNKHSMTIPFELWNSHIYLKVKINHSDTLSFLFDNGAATSGIMIDSSVASKIGLKETGKVRAILTGGNNDFLITDSVSLTINELFVTKQKVAWFLLKAQEELEGHKIDGILGYSFFKHLVFEIDYKRRKITVIDPDYYNDGKLKNKIAMIDLDNNKAPVVSGVLLTKDKKALKTKFVIDTGHDEYIVIGKKFIIKNKLAKDTLKIQPKRVNIGLGGETIHKLAKINSFSIASITISKPNTVFSFDEEGFYSTLDGVLLGGKFFKSYRLLLNYPKKYLVLTKS